MRCSAASVTAVIVLHQGKVMLDGSVQEVVDSDLVHAIYAGHTQPAGAQA